MLLSGDYKNGWEKYELRSKKQNKPATPHALPKCNQWNEEIAPNQVNQLLIVTEQGIGDTLQFMRYVKIMRQQSAKVSFCAEQKLHALIQASGIDPSPPHHNKATNSLMGSGYYSFDTKTFKGQPEPNNYRALHEVTDELNENGRNPHKAINTDYWHKLARQSIRCHKQSRNISTRSFRKIVEAYTGNFVCLQREAKASEIEEITLNPKTTPHQLNILRIADSEYPEDFLEYAAIITNCDLVITTGTTVAHMAAAIGIPTWVLLPKVPDWRWGLEGETTFWYPTMRLFRQKNRGDWNEVIERVAEALQERFRGISTPAKESAASQPAINPNPNLFVS